MLALAGGLVVFATLLAIVYSQPDDSTAPAAPANPPAQSEPGLTDETVAKNDALPESTETEMEPNSPPAGTASEHPADKHNGQTPPAHDEDKTAEPDQAQQHADQDDSQDHKTQIEGDPNDPLVPINFNNMEMKDVIPLLTEWTGRVVIPADDDVMGQKITIYANQKVPRSEALHLIYAALRMRGFVPEEVGNTLFLRPIAQAKLLSVPTIGPDEPVALYQDRDALAQKFFRLNNYSPARLQQIILPLMADYGYCTADQSTRSLVVIDTIANLQRIERIIQQLDTPAAEPMLLEVCELMHEDPVEIVQLLKILLADLGKNNTNSTPSGDRAVVVGANETPIVLIPEPKRSWVIVKAAPADMAQVKEWIRRLDQEGELHSDFTSIQVDHLSVRELADQVNRTMERLPGYEHNLRANVRILPLEQNNTLMVFGSQEKRTLIEKLVAEIDLPPLDLERRTFELDYADPERIRHYIEELYGESSKDSRSSRYAFYHYYGDSSRTSKNRDEVRVIDYPTLKRITVVAAPENMIEIAKLIKEWDKEPDIESLKPLIITLHNSDPVKMARLLSTLFSERKSSDFDMFRFFFWDDSPSKEQSKIVGPLYGQLSFEAVPDTKKIIVISKIPEAYEVVRTLIEELDRQEAAELPMIVTLKYADPEQLCERLNALLNKPGTPATIRLAQRRLSSYEAAATADTQAQRDNQNDKQDEKTGEYAPWWNSDRFRPDEEQPLSNIIGKVRFIPDSRSKAVLVVAPSEYLDYVHQMIVTLDQPAEQVMVKAVILQITHQNMTSLGLQLSSNPGAFAPLGENALAAFGFLKYFEQRGSANLGANTDVAALVDFLVKTTDAKVLNQPVLWAKDNEEAEFFRGRKVPRIEGSVSSEELTSIRQDVEFIPVGVTMRLRPNITPEKAIDLTINLIVSELEDELLLGNTVTSETNTTTHMIVDNGETLMLSGILFQNDRLVERKIPLLGDLPILDLLFKHQESVKTNDELLVFITPTVIGCESPAAQIELENAENRMHRSLADLAASVPPFHDNDHPGIWPQGDQK